MRIVTALLVSLYVWCVYRPPLAAAFPSGAPASACDTLTPNPNAHGAGPTDCPDPCPFRMRVVDDESGQYRCGETLDIIIESTDQTTYRGFFTQSRETSGVFTAEAPFVGSFVNPVQDTWQIRDCDGLNGGATHTNRDDKLLVSLQWQAPLPGEPAPSVTFWFSIVQVRVLYHVQLRGIVLSPDEASCQVGPPRIAFTQQSLTVLETEGDVDVCVILLDDAFETVTAMLGVLEDSASAGIDFFITENAISFAGGSPAGTVQCFTVTILTDEEIEGDEAFSLLLLSDQADIEPGSGTLEVIITDVPPEPVIAFELQTLTVLETDGNISVCVELLDPTPVTATLQVIGGSATVEEDYVVINSFVSFEGALFPGDLRCFLITIFTDGVAEEDETISLFLQSDNAPVDPIRNALVVTIIDVPPPDPDPVIGFELPSLTVLETDGDVDVCVILLDDASETVTAMLGVFEDSASAGEDFVITENAISFEEGSPANTVQCFTVTILTDEEIEGDEAFSLLLLSDQADIEPGSGTLEVIITDVPPEPVIAFVLQTLTVFETDTNISICVELLVPTPVTATLQVIGGSATVGEDYIVTDAFVSFAGVLFPGDVRCFLIDIFTDGVAEEDETISLFLQSDNAPVDPIRNVLVVTIIDVPPPDPDPVIGFELLSLTVSESVGSIDVCVVLLNEASEAVVATLAVVDGNALAEDDFDLSDTFVMFGQGSPPNTIQCFGIEIVEDQEVEGDEFFTLLVQSQQAVIAQARTIIRITIRDNDDDADLPVVGFELPFYRVLEGQTIEVCVVLISGVALDNLSLQMVSVLAGNALEDDLETVLTLVVFPQGSQNGSRQCVDVSANFDANTEPVEFLFLIIFEIEEQSAEFEIDITRTIVPLFIIDNPDPGSMAIVGFTETLVAVTEDVGAKLVCVFITTEFPLQQAVTVQITSFDITAMSFATFLDPPDYLAVNTTITIPSGTTNGTLFCISVTVIDDSVLENTESLFLTLTSLSPSLAVDVNADRQDAFIQDNEPRVSIFGLLLNEVNAREPGPILVCVQMLSSGPLLENLIFNHVGQNGSATEFEDFVILPFPPIFFPSGSRMGDIYCGRIFILNDDIAEPPEEFTVIVISQNEEVGVVFDPEVTVFVEDDDVLYIGFMDELYRIEEDGDEVFVCVEVLRTQNLTRELMVRISTSDGTAVAGDDYVTQRTELTYPIGTQVGDVQCLAVPIVDDNTPELPEYFDVNLTSFSPLVRVFPGRETTRVNILDDDTFQVRFSQEEFLAFEQPFVAIILTVELLGNRPLNDTGVVYVTTQDGTALDGSDYVAVNSTFVFPVGSPPGFRVFVRVEILNDNIAEANQTFTATLTSETPDVFSVADGGDLTTVTIVDDEVVGQSQILFELEKLTVREDVNEPVRVCVLVTGLSLLEEQAVIVVSTQPGTAQAPMDYIPFSITLTLPANTPNNTLSCTVIIIQDDDEMEEKEYFSLRIDNQTPDVVTVLEGDEELIVYIVDDDSPVAVVGFQVTESLVNESIANKFTCLEIFSGGPLLFDSDVMFYTQDGTAVAPDDYSSVSTTLTFLAGADGSRPSDAVCVSVPIIDDQLAEDTESVIFNIASLDEDRIEIDPTRSQKILYIEDNDGIEVGWERDEYAIFEFIGESDLGLLACVTVEDVVSPITLFVDTEDITAQEILDYRVNNSPLQFLVASGFQTQCAYVQVFNDGEFELVETFNLLLRSEDSSIVVINPIATVSIFDGGDRQL